PVDEHRHACSQVEYACFLDSRRAGRDLVHHANLAVSVRRHASNSALSNVVRSVEAALARYVHRVVALLVEPGCVVNATIQLPYDYKIVLPHLQPLRHGHARGHDTEREVRGGMV